MFLFFTLLLAANGFAAGWYSNGPGTEKCYGPENGILVCREIFKESDNFCYGKERVWSGFIRERIMYDRNWKMGWYDKKLIFVANLSRKCEYHGWARRRLENGTWQWQCYINNREAKDEDCKGFTKH